MTEPSGVFRNRPLNNIKFLIQKVGNVSPTCRCSKPGRKFGLNKTG